MRRLNTSRAIQAIAVLMRDAHRASMSRLRVLKLLYIAEREVLKETGRPLLGSKVVAMDHGPLHSAVYDLLKGQHIDEPLFSSYFSRHGYVVTCHGDPGVAELSPYEIGKLQEVVARYRDADDWFLAHEVTHEFEEWKRSYRPGTSSEIPLESIFAGVGRGSEAGQLVQEEREQAEFDRLFDSTPQS